MATVIDTLITNIVFRGDTRELQHAQEKMKKFRQGLDSLARNTGILGAALTGLGAAAARPILDFERSMNRLEAISGATSDQMVELRKQARELGATLPVTAAQAANAQNELALAGFSVQEIMASVPHVLDLAVAGELELGDEDRG